mmetsp:Transcript_13129/g.45921  ORF Transcript_13129/g.45921 Transcript_13129/m.45921 type:complete len:228 (+) Transcript_13129:1174-1857(+)
MLTRFSSVNWRRYMMCSVLRISLLPSERHCRPLQLSSPSMAVMALLYSDRSVSFVSVSRPSIFLMLLNDRSSHLRLTRWAMFSMRLMVLLSSRSVTRFSKPTRLSIWYTFLKDRARVSTSFISGLSYLERSTSSRFVASASSSMALRSSSSSITTPTSPDSASTAPDAAMALQSTTSRHGFCAACLLSRHPGADRHESRETPRRCRRARLHPARRPFRVSGTGHQPK